MNVKLSEVWVGSLKTVPEEKNIVPPCIPDFFPPDLSSTFIRPFSWCHQANSCVYGAGRVSYICVAVRAGNIELGEANGSGEGTEHFVVIGDFFNNQTLILQLLRHVRDLIALAVTLILSQRVPCLCTLWSFRNP